MRSEERQEFCIREEGAPDRKVRLTPYGELDLAAAGEFEERILRTLIGGAGVRLDLSELRFIDACGLRAVMHAVETAQQLGTRLEIEPRVSRSVARLVGLVGAEAALWPPAPRGVRVCGEAGKARQRQRTTLGARRWTAPAAGRH